MRGAHVEVREANTGEITIEYKGQPLAYSTYREQERRQSQVIETKLLDAALCRSPAKSKPLRGPVPMSHPWRRFDFSEKSMQAMERRGEICILRR